MHRQPGHRVAGRARTLIASTMVAAASVPLAGMAWGATQTSPPASHFACDSGSGIWQPLELDENHDNLYIEAGTETARPGEPVTFTLVWEWRDWAAGSTLEIRHCLDVDATPDGDATAPYDAMGGNPADATATQPTSEPAFTVMKLGEVRPAVRMPFSVMVPAGAPAGGEVCWRSAIIGPAADHRFSPPYYDISETACVSVAAPAAPAPPPPVETTSNNLGALPTSQVAPPPPAAKPVATRVLGVEVLPRTGLSIPALLLAGAGLVLGGALIASRRSRREGRPAKR
ncbi:MAG: LPXTG cell wall anchor domain-containing protein [Actinomycetota bacterium]